MRSRQRRMALTMWTERERVKDDSRSSLGVLLPDAHPILSSNSPTASPSEKFSQ